jgi:hypothetical protein
VAAAKKCDGRVNKSLLDQFVALTMKFISFSYHFWPVFLAVFIFYMYLKKALSNTRMK